MLKGVKNPNISIDLIHRKNHLDWLSLLANPLYDEIQKIYKNQHKQNIQHIKNELFEYVYDPDNVEKYMKYYGLSDDGFHTRWAITETTQ